MGEYISNGCRLGWLIDLLEAKVFVYKKDGSVSVVEGFDQVVSGEDVLEGFEMDLTIFKN